MQARIWQDVQARFSTYLFSSDLASFKFDNFLQVLGLVHRSLSEITYLLYLDRLKNQPSKILSSIRLMEVGDEFCGSQSEELQKSVRQQSEKYFGKYHHGCLEELRIFLENESWTHCPVKHDFSCLQLQVNFLVMKAPLLRSPSNPLSSIQLLLPFLFNFRNFVLYEEPFKIFIFMSNNRLNKVQTVAVNPKTVVLWLVVSFPDLQSLELLLTLLLVIYKKKTFL